MVIVYIGTSYIQVLYLGRAHRIKETLPDFYEWRRETRPPLVFRGLTGSQRTPRELGRHTHPVEGILFQVQGAFEKTVHLRGRF